MKKRRMTLKERLRVRKTAEQVRERQKAREKELAPKKAAIEKKFKHLRITGPTAAEDEAKKRLEATRALEQACKELNRAAKKPRAMPMMRTLDDIIAYLESQCLGDGRCGCEGTNRLLPREYKPLRAA